VVYWDFIRKLRRIRRAYCITLFLVAFSLTALGLAMLAAVTLTPGALALAVLEFYTYALSSLALVVIAFFIPDLVFLSMK
jgi:hypothetical protein